MDGTIIHSNSVWTAVIASLVGRKNVGLFYEIRSKTPGRGTLRTATILQSSFGMEGSLEEIGRIYEERTRDYFTRSSIDFIHGFHDFHKHLVTRNIPTSLVTNAPNYALDPLKINLALASFFGDHIYNSCTVNSTFKPDPAVLLHALDKLGITADECIIFEDSLEGTTAAKRAGIRCVGINSDDNLHELEQADFIIQHYEGLTIEKILMGLAQSNQRA